jgi:hypothetical protein
MAKDRRIVTGKSRKWCCRSHRIVKKEKVSILNVTVLLRSNLGNDHWIWQLVYHYWLDTFSEALFFLTVLGVELRASFLPWVTPPANKAFFYNVYSQIVAPFPTVTLSLLKLYLCVCVLCEASNVTQDKNSRFDFCITRACHCTCLIVST